MGTWPVLAPDGTIYRALGTGIFDAKHPDGTLSWALWMTSGVYPSSPAIGADGMLYFTIQLNLRVTLFAVRPDGTTNWARVLAGVTATPSSRQRSAPTIGPDGTIYVASSLSQYLFSMRPDGSTNWIFRLRARTYSSPTFGPDGSVYLGSEDGTLYCFDPRGFKKWEFAAGRFVEASPAVSSDGTIYFGSGDGNTYALASNGAKKWAAATGGIAGSPAILADGSILVGSYQSNMLYALSPNGSNLWTFATPQEIITSPTIGPDGTIYICAGSNLYALFGTNAPMTCSWAMSRHDAQQTGRTTQRAIQSISVLPDGNIALNLGLDSGRNYTVECSSDLCQWTELSNFVSDTFTYQFLDLTATNSPQRFYRLVTSP